MLPQIVKSRLIILEHTKLINHIQDTCKHPEDKVEYKNKSDTGNWDNNDSYWADYHCLRCDKRWSDDQHKYPKGTKL